MGLKTGIPKELLAALLLLAQGPPLQIAALLHCLVTWSLISTARRPFCGLLRLLLSHLPLRELLPQWLTGPVLVLKFTHGPIWVT